MDNKTVLITGSSSGIGAEIAVKFSQSGYKIFLTGRNELKLCEMSAKTNAAGFLAVDLGLEGASKKLFETAENILGEIDIIVNNAGGYVWSPVEKTEHKYISEILKVNLQVPYELCSYAAVGMKQRKWGRIINIGSISGVVGEPNASLYSASKSGLVGLTKSLALELAEHNITVNLINPGWVKTGMAEEVFENNILDEAEQLDMIPQRRFIHPSEIAELAAYLASENAKGITGQSINICAGLSIG